MSVTFIKGFADFRIVLWVCYLRGIFWIYVLFLFFARCFGACINYFAYERKYIMNQISVYDPFRFIDELWSRSSLIGSDSFPPFNIRQVDENTRVLELATAGFSREELRIEVKGNNVLISGERKSDDNSHYLHKGIAARKFSRSIALWEYWEVSSAGYENGILSVEMKRNVPESAKPKEIKIN